MTCTSVAHEVCATRLLLRHRWFISSDFSTPSPIPADSTEEFVGTERVEGDEFEGDKSVHTSETNDDIEYRAGPDANAISVERSCACVSHELILKRQTQIRRYVSRTRQCTDSTNFVFLNILLLYLQLLFLFKAQWLFLRGLNLKNCLVFILMLSKPVLIGQW